MNVQAIIANVIDRCGGDLIREKIPTATATLHVLNQLEICGLELADTFKGTCALKLAQVWSTQDGELPTSPKFLNRPQYVRYRQQDISPNTFGWLEIFVVNDIEELTHAENVGRKSVWFSGQHPFSYKLSFIPINALDVEVWGQTIDSSISNLSAVPKLPEEFSQLIAVQASIRLLDDLLLLDQSARYQAFIGFRKASLQADLLTLLYLWENFKNRDENRNMDMTREAFDVFGDAVPAFLQIEY